MMRMISPMTRNTPKQVLLLVLDTLICLSHVLDASFSRFRKGKKRKEEEVSVNEWVDVDEDYNAAASAKLVEIGRASVRKMMSL